MTFIEYARKEELHEVADLIMKRGEEIDYEATGFPKPCRGVVYDTVLRNWHLAPCLVVKKENEIIGLASLNLTSFGWSTELVLSPFMIYVLPEHRSYDIVKAIYDKIKEFALLHRLLFVDDYIAVDRVDGRRRMMRQFGFKEAGFLLTYDGR